MVLSTGKTVFRLNVGKGKVIASKDFGKPGGLTASLERTKTGTTRVHTYMVSKKDFTRKGNLIFPKTARGRNEAKTLKRDKKAKIYIASTPRKGFL